jgi:PhnB protein
MLSVRNGARAVDFYKTAFGAIEVYRVEDPAGNVVADAMFARALAAGAREVFPVSQAHGWRLGRVVDPFGHHWEIGRPLTS